MRVELRSQWKDLLDRRSPRRRTKDPHQCFHPGITGSSSQVRGSLLEASARPSTGAGDDPPRPTVPIEEADSGDPRHGQTATDRPRSAGGGRGGMAQPQRPSWIDGYWNDFRSPRRDHLMGKVKEVFGVPTSVLDVGCNVSPNLRRIAEELPGCRLSGFDINEEAIEAGERRLGLLELTGWSAERALVRLAPQLHERFRSPGLRLASPSHPRLARAGSRGLRPAGPRPTRPIAEIGRR